jgi:hypothetical protein
MFLPCHHNTGQNHNLMTANKFFKHVTKLKNVGTAATDQTFVQEKINSRLNSGNICYHSVQNLLYSLSSLEM